MPAPYLLDTTVLLHWTRNSPQAQAIDATFQLSSSAMRPLVCEVSLGEMLAFSRSLRWGAQKLRRLAELERHVVVVHLSDPGVRQAYAELSTLAQSAGWSLFHGKNDLWVGAAAHAADAHLLTMDADFLPLRGRGGWQITVLDEKTGFARSWVLRGLGFTPIEQHNSTVGPTRCSSRPCCSGAPRGLVRVRADHRTRIEERIRAAAEIHSDIGSDVQPLTLRDSTCARYPTRMKTGVRLRQLSALVIGCSLAMSSCTESNHQLADDSHLPKWFSLDANDTQRTAYQIVTVDGTSEIIEPRERGPLLHVTDEPALRRA